MAVGAAYGPVATSARFRSGIARYSGLPILISAVRPLVFRSLTSNL
jgi:hypothetical protein